MMATRFAWGCGSSGCCCCWPLAEATARASGSTRYDKCFVIILIMLHHSLDSRIPRRCPAIIVLEYCRLLCHEECRSQGRKCSD